MDKLRQYDEYGGLLKLHADPEVGKQHTDEGRSFNARLIVRSNDTNSLFRALAADYDDKALYFGDYTTGYIGKWDMEREVTERYFEGMAHGIESIACDTITRNIYFTDSAMKWVMVTDKGFKYYTPVYRTSPEAPYGLAIHSVQRLDEV